MNRALLMAHLDGGGLAIALPDPEILESQNGHLVPAIRLSRGDVVCLIDKLVGMIVAQAGRENQ